MAQEIMWSLLVTMAAIAISAVLDAVKHRRELHLSDKELSRAREKIDSLQQEHQQSISDLEKVHLDEKRILGNQIISLAHKLPSEKTQRQEYDPYSRF